MRITDVAFAGSAATPDQFPRDRLPEVALLGRSNVGKSSVINRLVNRKTMAHVSATPGKTHTLNFFRVNSAFHLVDLPGYGYAKVGRDERASWASLIEGYLTGRTELAGAILILDLRHPPTEDDRLMLGFVRSRGLPAVVLATKADQVKRAQLRSKAAQLGEALDLGEHDALVVFSAHEPPPTFPGLPAGVDAAWKALVERVPAIAR